MGHQLAALRQSLVLVRGTLNVRVDLDVVEYAIVEAPVRHELLALERWSILLLSDLIRLELSVRIPWVEWLLL